MKHNIEDILTDPAASFWLKDAFRTAVIRDPVDAANDAEVLAAVLRRRAQDIAKRQLEVLRGNLF